MPSKYQAGGGGSMGSNFGGRSTAAGGTRAGRGVRQTTYKTNAKAFKKAQAADKRYAAADKKVGKIISQDNKRMINKQVETGKLDIKYREVPRKLKTAWKKNSATATRQLLKGVEVKKTGVSAVKPSLSKTAKPSAKTLKKGKK